MEGQPDSGTSRMTLTGAADHLAGLLDGNENAMDTTSSRKTEPDDEPVDGEEATEDTTDSAEGDASEDESDAEGTDAEPEEQPEEPAKIESLADLAKELDVPVEELTATLKHEITVNGEKMQVTLKELQAGYQKDADYRQKTEALSRERETITQKQAEAEQRLNAGHMQTGQMLNFAEQILVGQVNAAELNELRTTNPAEWAARRAEIGERIEAVRQLRQHAANQWAEQQQRIEGERRETLQKTLDAERETLRSKIQNWDDVRPSLTKYLLDDFGFTPDQLSGVADHRLMLMAHKAMQFDAAQKAADETVKAKVKPAPQKVLKPTKPMTSVEINRARLGSARNALKKSGKIGDAASLILASGIIKGPK